jgi:Male sterility protein
LGLSDEHYKKVVATAQIVYHMAASVSFTSPLKSAIKLNLTGTKHVIDICKQMTSLIAAIHLSTAFCCCDQEVLEEKVYDWKQDPMDMIRCAEGMSEEAMVWNNLTLKTSRFLVIPITEQTGEATDCASSQHLHLHQATRRDSCSWWVPELADLHLQAIDRHSCP